jgi:hypothetical protein
MKYKNAASLLAITLAAAVPLFADGIRGGSKYVTFSEGFTSQQSGQGASAECNFLLGATKENGLSTSATAMGEKGSTLGSSPAPSGNSINLVNFNGNDGASSDKDKGKGKGKPGGGSGNGNGTTPGNGAPSPVIAVTEPGSRSLLLFGLACLAMLVFRRKTFTIAV